MKDRLGKIDMAEVSGALSHIASTCLTPEPECCWISRISPVTSIVVYHKYYVQFLVETWIDGLLRPALGPLDLQALVGPPRKLLGT